MIAILRLILDVGSRREEDRNYRGRQEALREKLEAVHRAVLERLIVERLIARTEDAFD